MAISPPFALFVGPTKSGTTWVQSYLEARGDVAMPRDMKETFYFDKVYDRGFGWYENLFPPAEDTRLRVEIAPSLFHKPFACDRVAKDIPYAKIICTVRNPFDRAVSHYFHYRARGLPRSSLSEASKVYADVIDAGSYAKHSPMWEKAFGNDRVFLLSYQLLRDDPDAFCRQLCEVLEIDYIPPAKELIGNQVNAAKVPRNLAAAKAFQAITSQLRRRGLHRVTKALKFIPVKKWLFSSGDHLESERAQIKQEAASFSPELMADWGRFMQRSDFPDAQ